MARGQNLLRASNMAGFDAVFGTSRGRNYTEALGGDTSIRTADNGAIADPHRFTYQRSFRSAHSNIGQSVRNGFIMTDTITGASRRYDLKREAIAAQPKYPPQRKEFRLVAHRPLADNNQQKLVSKTEGSAWLRRLWAPHGTALCCPTRRLWGGNARACLLVAAGHPDIPESTS